MHHDLLKSKTVPKQKTNYSEGKCPAIHKISLRITNISQRFARDSTDRRVITRCTIEQSTNLETYVITSIVISERHKTCRLDALKLLNVRSDEVAFTPDIH